MDIWPLIVLSRIAKYMLFLLLREICPLTARSCTFFYLFKKERINRKSFRDFKKEGIITKERKLLLLGLSIIYVNNNYSFYNNSIK